jgi:hypothetical protein
MSNAKAESYAGVVYKVFSPACEIRRSIPSIAYRMRRRMSYAGNLRNYRIFVVKMKIDYTRFFHGGQETFLDIAVWFALFINAKASKKI